VFNTGVMAIENPFAVLTAVVAPAILTNACSVLSLGTANRVARVVDRTRVISDFDAIRDPKHQDHEHYRSQLDRLQVRGRLLFRALRLFYFALGAFAASALIAVIGSALTALELDRSFHIGAVVGLGIGAVAVACLATGCALMVRETKLAIESMEEAAKLYTGAPPDAEL
jgi:hypothetical protein